VNERPSIGGKIIGGSYDKKDSDRRFGWRHCDVSLGGDLPHGTAARRCGLEPAYWNWYGFPTVFTAAQLADRLIGFVLIGVTLAAIVKPPAPATPAQQPAVSPT